MSIVSQEQSKLQAVVNVLKTKNTNLTIKDLQDNVAKMAPLEFNEFITGLFNKVFKSYLFKRVLFTHPIISTFITEGTSFEAHREYFDTKLIESEDFDVKSKFSNDQKLTKTLQTVLSTQLKKFLRLSTNINYAKAAFASESAFSSWLESQFRVITESMNVELYKEISKKVTSAIKNEYDWSSENKLEDVMLKLNTLSDNMAFPSRDYNLGFANTSGKITGHDDETRVNATKRDQMVLFVSPKIKNLLDAKVGSVKFHNQYFDITKYNVITLEEELLTEDGSKREIMILCDKEAFKGYFRINDMASQFWAKNMTVEYFQHYWLVFGEIPWANGVKIKLSSTLNA